MDKKFQEILTLVHQTKVEDALKKCVKVIRKKPGNINYLLLAASIHAQQENYNEIINYCQKALKIEPGNINALYNGSLAFLHIKDYENAAKFSRKILKLDKKHPGAHSNLALACWNTGDIEEAEEHGLVALKLEPDFATTHNNLGLIYKSLNDYEKAIKHFKNAIQLDPQISESYYNLAITLWDDDRGTANEYLEKALIINPGYPDAYNFKGLKLAEDQQIFGAIDCFKKAILHNNEFAEAYCNLGNVYMTDQQYMLAEAMYRKAIELNPGYASAYNNLGNAILDQDDYRSRHNEAIECYHKAIELMPELNDTYKNLAIHYQGQGDQEKALHYFTIYNEREPDDQIAIAGMASVYERCGDYNAGIELLRPYINSSNCRTEIALAYAKLAKHFKEEDRAIELLEKVNDDETINKNRIEKYYSLGKLTEPKGDADKTFKYYKTANDLEVDVFDMEQEKQKLKNIKEYFSKEKIQSLSRSENGTNLPIFIVGMPRSGTSLAEQILSSHPDVYGAGELENIHHLTLKAGTELQPKNNYPYCIDSMDVSYANKLANEHINDLKKLSNNAQYIVDKMPHNFIGLGFINLIFPNATVIHCKRSSIDTCLSIYFQHFNKHHSYSNSLKMLGEYYNQYADMMEHWKKTLDINLIELEYESVIESPEEKIRSLLQQCKIDWDPACLKFHENKRTVMTPSYDQVRRPIYKSSVAKWKQYESHIDELIQALGDRAY